MLRLKFKSELDSYYHSLEYCKHQFFANKNKLAFFEELRSQLKQKYDQDAVYYVGDRSEDSTIKDGVDYDTVSLELYIMRHEMNIVSVDANFTLQNCTHCWSDCVESTSARVSNESGAKETRTPRSIRTCTNPNCMGSSRRTRKRQGKFQCVWNIV